MIVDHLSNAAFYHGLGSRFATAFEYLAKTDFSALAAGRHDVEGDEVFAMVQSYDSRVKNAESLWEAHRKYIDIQYILSGQEQMGYGPADVLTITTPYSDENDVVLFKEKPGQAHDYVRVSTGMFTIFAPHDAHQPGMAIDQPQKVSKVVMKLRVN